VQCSSDVVVTDDPLYELTSVGIINENGGGSEGGGSTGPDPDPEQSRTSYRFIEAFPQIPGNDTTKIRGIVEFKAEFGNFTEANWTGSQGLWMDKNYKYTETSNIAVFRNTPTKLAKAGFTGNVIIVGKDTYSVGVTKEFTYAQAFTP
jgi:hypothetical protein